MEEEPDGIQKACFRMSGLATDPPYARTIAVWWTDQACCEAIGDQDNAPRWLPEYVREQYWSRYGRAGRGRLWAHERFQDLGRIRIAWPDPETPLARWLGKGFAGIVIEAADVPLLHDLPGVVTDMWLRPWAPAKPDTCPDCGAPDGAPCDNVRRPGYRGH